MESMEKILRRTMKQHFSFLLALIMLGGAISTSAQVTLETDVTETETTTDEGTTKNSGIVVFGSENGKTHSIVIGKGQPSVAIGKAVGEGSAEAYTMAFPWAPMPCGGSFLGVYGDEVTKELVEKLKLPGEYGAHVLEVIEGSAAEKAGLQKEDVIIGYNGTRVESMAQLRRMVGETPVGRMVSLTIVRNGTEQRIDAELAARAEGEVTQFFGPVEWGEHLFNFDTTFNFNFDTTFNFNFNQNEDWLESMPEDAREKMQQHLEELELHLQKLPEPNGMLWFGEQNDADAVRPRVYTRMLMNDGVKLGVSVQSLTPQLGRYFKLDEGQKGVLISEVMEGFPAEAADLRAGDVIVGIESEDVDDPFDISRIIRDNEGVVQVHVIRDGRERSIPVDLGSRERKDLDEDKLFFVPETDGSMELRNK